MKAGHYQTTAQFQADVSKIWTSSYAKNDKNSKIYKSAIEMEKYYKKLIGSPAPKRQNKNKAKVNKDANGSTIEKN